ncbi:uncharacterized protein [Salminus brasiliensis]|uniref:uncharacterized protein n=1 Tax=Salminus brasiliensis TaxID=930266 RepID=UPI003B834A54
MNPTALIAAAAPTIIHGASLIGTSAEKISRAINTWRNVTIQITNHSCKYTLEQPRTYTISGYCHHPPQPTIAKNTQEVCSFTKTAHTARGAVGVLTYSILTDEQGCVGEMVIMFSVPFDYNCYKNWFALGIFESGVSCDEKLYKQMYYESGPFTRANGTGSCITYFKKEALLKGTMSPQGHSVIKVEFWDNSVAKSK